MNLLIQCTNCGQVLDAMDTHHIETVTSAADPLSITRVECEHCFRELNKIDGSTITKRAVEQFREANIAAAAGIRLEPAPLAPEPEQPTSLMVRAMAIDAIDAANKRWPGAPSATLEALQLAAKWVLQQLERNAVKFARNEPGAPWPEPVAKEE
jgi:hypothetical protein